MKYFSLFILFSAIVLSGCGKPWQKGKNDPGVSILLTNQTLISGTNSECTAIVNAMTTLGYQVNETMVYGGGGAMSFMYQENAFPFILTKGYYTRDIFLDSLGVNWKLVRGPNARESWEGPIKLLKQGIPVILRLDQRFLPFRYGGKYGPDYKSYGWHMVVLYGIDTTKGVAWVSDAGYTNLQEILLTDLDKARDSFTKVYTPFREYFWIDKKPEGFKVDWKKLTDNSIRHVVKNMEQGPPQRLTGLKTLVGLEGLKDMPNQINKIEELVNYEMFLSSVFHSFYVYIEEFETGGAAGRLYYRDFLIQAKKETGDPRLDLFIKGLDKSIKAWHILAEEFNSISVVVKNEKDKAKRAALYTRAAAYAQDVYVKEKAVYDDMKKWK